MKLMFLTTLHTYNDNSDNNKQKSVQGKAVTTAAERTFHRMIKKRKLYSSLSPALDPLVATRETNTSTHTYIHVCIPFSFITPINEDFNNNNNNGCNASHAISDRFSFCTP